MSSDPYPPSWTIAKLGCLAQHFESGKRPKGGVSKVKEGILSLGGEHLRGTGRLSSENPRYVPREFAESLRRVKVRADDILIVKDGATTGKTSIATSDFAGAVINEHLFQLRPVEGLSSRFLFFFLWSCRGKAEIMKDFRGSAQGGITKAVLDLCEIPVAPLGEQHRIVEKIETLFAEIDKGEEALRKVQRLLKQYRQSVLKAAVTGELTADWRAENAGGQETGRDLLERILKARRENWTGRGKYKEPVPPDTSDLPELPEGWVWTSIGQLIFNIDAGKNFRCDERPPQDGETGVVKISSVTWDQFNENESKTIRNPSQVRERDLIAAGNLLMSRANTIELVGASCVVDQITKKLQLSDKVLRLNCVYPFERWLNIVLKSCLGRRQIEAAATGAQMSMRNIAQRNIERIAVPLPPASEMGVAEEVVTNLHTAGDQTAFQTELEFARAASLRQSILKDAFSGRLVPQDPNDEPASELLARIKATSTAAPRKARKSKARI